MIGMISSTTAIRRSAERMRRLVSLLCMLVFLIGGIAHIDHGAASSGSAISIVSVDADNGGDESGKTDRLLAKTCHSCSLPALPAPVAQFDLAPRLSVLPPGVVAFLNVRSPGAELPPPKLSA